jgi:hypothetical protein
MREPDQVYGVMNILILTLRKLSKNLYCTPSRYALGSLAECPLNGNAKCRIIDAAAISLMVLWWPLWRFDRIL